MLLIYYEFCYNDVMSFALIVFDETIHEMSIYQLGDLGILTFYRSGINILLSFD